MRSYHTTVAAHRIPVLVVTISLSVSRCCTKYPFDLYRGLRRIGIGDNLVLLSISLLGFRSDTHAVWLGIVNHCYLGEIGYVSIQIFFARNQFTHYLTSRLREIDLVFKIARAVSCTRIFT